MARIDLTGRPIAITGASSGIGAALALDCAKAGMPVALAARRVDRLESIAKRITDAGGRAIVFELDVRDGAACGRFIDRTVEAFGSLYAVCANAGYGLERSFHETDEATLRDLFETNFFGSVNFVRPAVQRMLAAEWNERAGVPRGHVLWMSSCLAKMTIPYYGPYSATKAAQSHVGRAMRLELEPLGIRVSIIHPISTRTEFFAVAGERSQNGPLAAHSPAFFTQDAAVVSRKTLAVLRSNRPEVWTGFKGWVARLGMSINTFSPRLADFTTRGMVSRRTKH